MIFYVKYTVLDKQMQVGPYGYCEAIYQLNDIRGFEGVTNVYLEAQQGELDA